MDYLKNARKTRGKEEYYIVQSLQLQPLLCYPRDRRIAVSGANFNRRGAVSGASCLHTQRTNIARPNHIPPVGTLVRASASGGAPSRGPVSMGGVPSRGPVVCTHTTHKHRAPQPHPTCRDARSSVSKRRGTVSGPSFNGRGAVSGPASEDQATIIHCSGRALCRPRTQRTYKYHTNVHPLQGVSLRDRPQPTNNQRASIPHTTHSRDARSSVRKQRVAAPGPFTNVSKPHLLLGCLLAVHLAMRIKDASQPLRG